MFNNFFMGLQHDLLILCVAPLLSAIFRAVFIKVYHPYENLSDKKAALYHCFRYGFWWGMDFHAYVFLLSMLLISLPAAFLPAYFSYADTVRTISVTTYALILYCAFLGKMMFYFHYHDIYNHILWLGAKAEKHNLLDVFLNQHHGWLQLISIPIYIFTVGSLTHLLLTIPALSAPVFASPVMNYAFDTIVFISAIAFFYYCRFGGTFKHADKPEWDEIPSVTKKEHFLAKATVDDLVALELVWHNPIQGLRTQTDADGRAAIEAVIPPEKKNGLWEQLPSPVNAFLRKAKGAKIKPPRHIFLIVGESYGQQAMEPHFAPLHMADEQKKFFANEHTAYLTNFLPAGMISRPAIVSLMSGIYDAKLELNENTDFWQGTTAAALPVQLKKLGYRCLYWYGGNPTYGNFQNFGPAVGFDQVNGATEFCPPDSPRTWVGVYDHIFLEHAAKMIEEDPQDQPTFHFIYTTSNHGPYKMKLSDYGFEPQKIMPEVYDVIKDDHKLQKMLGTYWYSDKAIMAFANRMKERFPDSLIIITGDHACPIAPYNKGLAARKEATLRENFCTSFGMYHREITQDILAGNTIGCHMNIAPTILELIAPKGFEYISLFPPLTEYQDHVVTPYHWLTEDAIGSAENNIYQAITPTDKPLPLHEDENKNCRYQTEIHGYNSITGWLVRHPEQLQPASNLSEK